MNLVVLTPHFAPDVAPTGAVVTRIVEELALRGHRIEVLTSLPWYREHRVEPGFEGQLVRREDVAWGRITRIHPLSTSDKQNIARRAIAFSGFSTIAAGAGLVGGPFDAVLAVSPPLTLALAGWVIARRRAAPLVFNVQDVFPDVAIELGALRGERTIAAARKLERFCYEHSDAITVLSDDLRANIAAKTSDPGKVHVIPNFVDTKRIVPSHKENDYRREFGLQGRFVVMYAGNVGLSQPLEIVLDAAAQFRDDDRVVFVINGHGARRAELQRQAQHLANVRFVDMQPIERLPQVLAAADVHVVLLRQGLARASVPSKTYSALAAGRPLIAGVDAGSEVARIVERNGCGIGIPPEDPDAFAAAVARLLDDPITAEAMGAAGRSFVEGWASPEAVARAYEDLFTRLARR